MITKEEFEILKKVKNMFEEKCEEFIGKNKGCANCDLYDICGYYSDEWDLSKIEKEIIITTEEYIILNSLDKKSKEFYIVRNKNGDLTCRFKKPKKLKNNWSVENFDDYLDFRLFSHIFKLIKWEDDEPKKIINYIKGYEKWQNKTEKK